MEKKVSGSSKNSSTVLALVSSVAFHLRTAYCPDHVLFYIHEKCLHISINDHFSYVLT